MSTTNGNNPGLTDSSYSSGSHSHEAEPAPVVALNTTTTTFGVAGMTCAHCVASVTTEIEKLAGTEGVTVTLVPGGVSRVSVASASPLDRTAVAAAIGEAGYELVSGTR